MKRKGLKCIAAAMAVTMGITAAGCQKESSPASSQTDEQKTEETVQAGETAQAAQDESGGALADEENLYGYSQPVSIKFGFSYGSDFKYREGESAVSNPWNDLYQANGINVDVLYEVDGTQAVTKFNNAVASGTYPDVFSAGATDLKTYAKTGVIADITEVYEKYASDELKEYINSDGGMGLSSAMVDGRLYGIPKMGNGYDNVMMMFVRQDWLDKLNLKMPETMDELVETAKAFTEMDPDGNGKADTYGLGFNGKNVFDMVGGIQAFFEGYGAAPGYWNGQFTFIEKEGKVLWGGNLPEEMKEGLTVLQQMYKDGSIPKDFGVMDSNALTEDLSAGRCGIFFAPMWGAMGPSANAVKNDIDAHFTAAPIPDGNGEGSSKAYFASSVDNAYYTVSSKCSNPEVLIKLMNLSVQKLCHPKDEDEFKKYYVDNGYQVWKYSLTQTTPPLKNYDNWKKESKAVETGNTDGLNTEQMSDYTNMKAYLDAMAGGSPDLDDPAFQAGIGLYTVFGDPVGGYAAIDKMIQEDAFNKSVYNTVPTETMAAKYPTLNKMAMETIVKIISGDSVEDYDAFLETWNKLGGEDVTKEAQSWYDSQK